jgi:pimeloyl-ACP methyl ester carboxylesterase
MSILFNHSSGHFLENDGASIYYEEAGRADAPALLLLHGGFGHLEEFNPILPELAPQLRLIGIDSRGHGRSSLGEKGLSYELLQKDVEAVVKHLGLSEFAILGFSDGGIVAYRLAALTSLPITKIVTVGAAWHSKSEAFIRENRSKFTSDSMRQRLPEYYEAYQRLSPAPDFDQFVDLLLDMWVDESEQGHPNEAVANISCSVLAARGDHDHLVPLADIAELAGIAKNVAFSNIPFAGHAAFNDQPEVFLLQMKQFLEL